MKKTILFTFIILLAGIHLKAQLTIQSEFRNRVELRDGYRGLTTEGSTPAMLIWQRTRMSFNYETDNFVLKITPQDVRLWGDESQQSSTGVFGNDASLELFEGFVGLKLGNLGWLSAGRQQLKYDNERLLSARNWNNSGLSYDVLLFKLKVKTWNIHVGSTWNSMKEVSSGNLYPSSRIKNLNFLWVNRNLGDCLSLSILHLASGVTKTDTTNTLCYKHTTGLYSAFEGNILNIWAEAYYQYGRTNAGNAVNAYLCAVDASYKVGNYVPGAGITFLSGNRKIGAEQTYYSLFDTHYGAMHRFYGFMDYFRNFSSETKQGGLTDIYVYHTCKLTKAFSIQNISHYFWLAQANSATPDDKNLGFENDLVIKYQFNNWGVLEVGYLFFLPSQTIKIIQGVNSASFQQFAYLQLILTPTLFRQTTHNIK